MCVKPYLIIRTFKKMGSVQGTAEELGIYRSTVYRWISKARTASGALSEKELRRKSTRPHTIYRALSLEEESAIIKIKKEKGHEAEKIKTILNLSASRNTIHRLFVKKGLVQPHGYH